MKKLLLVILAFYSTGIHSQDSLTIFIAADREVSEVLTPQKIYKYSEFKAGKIIFRDGSFAENNFNYNYLNREIEFIEKDTLAIAKNQMLNIRFLTVDKDTFFYDRGYLQQIIRTPSAKLLQKQKLAVTKREKIGAYNLATETSAIDSYGSYTDNFGVLTPHLKIRENITLVLKTDFYFADRFNTFLPANKKNLQKLFPNKTRQIDNYLKAHYINYKNAEDLKKLLVFLN
jgi:uncharacterized protein (UPF0216 family)